MQIDVGLVEVRLIHVKYASNYGTNEFPAILKALQDDDKQTKQTMADQTDKNPLNVPGTYYNDLTCIDCDLCREMAPNIFKRDDGEGLTYVWRQPSTPVEIAAAEEALRSCPTETIGNDGE